MECSGAVALPLALCNAPDALFRGDRVPAPTARYPGCSPPDIWRDRLHHAPAARIEGGHDRATIRGSDRSRKRGLVTGLAQALARLAGTAAAAFVAEYRKGLEQPKTRTELSSTSMHTSMAWRPTTPDHAA